MSIVIRPQTMQEAFAHTIYVIQTLTFDKKYYYQTLIPPNDTFIDMSHIGHAKYKSSEHIKLFEQALRDPDIYTKATTFLNQHKHIIIECIDTLSKISSLMQFEHYEIQIVTYGVGGEYNIDDNKATISIQIQDNGEWYLAPPAINPIEKAVRLIILCMLHPIVKQYRFAHSQKMAIHDAIFLQMIAPILSKYFPDDHYTTRQYHDEKLFGLIITHGIKHLNQTIQHYITEKKGHEEQHFINLLIEYGMTNSEAQIYFQIYKFNELPVATIARLTNIKRTTVYATLKRMMIEGIAYHINKNDIEHYRVITIKKLITIKEHHIYQLSKKIQSLECVFTPTDETKSNSPTIAHYEGINHIKNLYKKILTSSVDTSIVYRSTNPNYPADIYSYLQDFFWPEVKKRKLNIQKNTPDTMDDKSIISTLSKLYDEIWIVNDHIICFCFGEQKSSGVVMGR